MKKQIFVIFFLATLISLPAFVYSQEDDTTQEEISAAIDTLGDAPLTLIKGELVTLKVYNLNRLSLTDPEIADIIDAKEEEVLIIGQQIGQTILFIWDDHGKRDIVINVVNRDLASVRERLGKLLKAADIDGPVLEVNDQEGKVVVSGQVPEKKRIQFDKLMLNFDDDVIDVTKEEEIEDLVQVDVQISELRSEVTKNLGIEWSSASGTDSGGGSSSGSGSGGTSLSPTYGETLPDFDGSISDFFKIGDFRRTNALKASIQAKIAEGKGRVLSQPKLVVVSGREASFLVGGQIPIRTTTTTDSGATQGNVQFKDYGISMTVTPLILKDQKIDVTMGLEVSDADPATAIGGGQDVAFITREADTRLVIDDGQTIIMAGLMRESRSDLVNKVPFLGDIPIMGLLFRSRTMPTPESNTELVIMLTPHIMRSSSVAQKEEAEERTVDTQGTIAKYTSGAKPYYSGIPHEMRDYVRTVQDKISQSIQYPREAIQYGWEGTVKVNMLILQDGTLAFALVRESSGYDVIDENALQMAKLSAPYSAFPTETKLQELNVTIPIVYSLNRN